MDAFETDALVAAQHRAGEHTYEDFLRKDLLSAGLAIWPAGLPDVQEPHTEDEVYIVMSGRGRIRVGQEDEPVGPGSVVYVATGVEHRFHAIEEDLHVLVFWAPPYGSRAANPAGGLPGEAAGR